jgi:hypothetical protein
VTLKQAIEVSPRAPGRGRLSCSPAPVEIRGLPMSCRAAAPLGIGWDAGAAAALSAACRPRHVERRRTRMNDRLPLMIVQLFVAMNAVITLSLAALA